MICCRYVWIVMSPFDLECFHFAYQKAFSIETILIVSHNNNVINGKIHKVIRASAGFIYHLQVQASLNLLQLLKCETSTKIILGFSTS